MASGGYSLLQWLLTAVASLAAEHGLYVQGLQQLWHVDSVVVACGPQGIQASVVVVLACRLLVHGLSSCGAWAWLLHRMWNLPIRGIELVSPALAGRLPSTVPQGKSSPAFIVCRSFDDGHSD